ncbi:MAG: hypothetical protein P4M08_11780 [Oligoflexia bacterium]|nr:hypothetical protein [Oligoflexia bacterium]
MLSFEAYKVLHIVGALMAVSGLIAVSMFSWVNSGANAAHPARKLAAATHGFGLLIILIAGFGMLARLQIPTNQPWIAGKLGIWLVLGGMVALARRMPKRAPLIWLATFILAGLAAALAIYKP